MEQPFSHMMERFLTGSMSQEERQQFIELIKSGEYEAELNAAIDDAMHENRFAAAGTDLLKDDLYRQLSKELHIEKEEVIEMKNGSSFFKKYWWAAAVVLVVAGTLIYPFVKKKAGNETVQPVVAQVLPGTYGAVLTLGDGSSVLLDSMGNGIVTQQDGVQIRLEDNQLIYDQSKNEDVDRKVFNTMSTPRGRQFMLTLPDGTKVWMNAASSIRYPAMFGAKEREVQVTGELYFDVAKDASRPFRVRLNDGSRIEILGTSFNINAYEDEAQISTTLVEGSVRIVNDAGKSILLQPLQQAQINKRGNNTDKNTIKVLNSADIEKIIAWKNGAFDFTSTSLEEMMRQLARWYDISIDYPQGVPALEFEGKMSRNITLNGLLKILDQTGVHFRLEGKKLIVLP